MCIRDSNDILATENRHFGYRVANEISRFVTLGLKQCGHPDAPRAAFDLAILSKVLPKLHGTEQELSELLYALFEFAVGGPKRDLTSATWNGSGSDFVGTLKTDDVVQRLDPMYPRTAEKIHRMRRRLRRQGFTSFVE